MWNYLESESATIFLVPLMCWQYRYTLLLTSVQHIHHETASWPPSFTGSNDALCIHHRALELSEKSRMWDSWPSFWIVIYIDAAEARNSARFSVSTPCHSAGCVPAPCHDFVILPSDPIFTGIGPYCDCLGREDYVVYRYYFLCDPLEYIYKQVQVLYVPVLEVLWATHHHPRQVPP